MTHARRQRRRDRGIEIAFPFHDLANGTQQFFAHHGFSPVPASATTSISGSTFNEAESPMRTMKWSSTTRIRIGFGLDIGQALALYRCFYRELCSASKRAFDF